MAYIEAFLVADNRPPLNIESFENHVSLKLDLWFLGELLDVFDGGNAFLSLKNVGLQLFLVDFDLSLLIHFKEFFFVFVDSIEVQGLHHGYRESLLVDLVHQHRAQAGLGFHTQLRSHENEWRLYFSGVRHRHFD